MLVHEHQLTALHTKELSCATDEQILLKTLLQCIKKTVTNSSRATLVCVAELCTPYRVSHLHNMGDVLNVILDARMTLASIAQPVRTLDLLSSNSIMFLANSFRPVVKPRNGQGTDTFL